MADLPHESPSAGPPGVTRPAILILNRDLFFGVRLRQALVGDGWEPRLVPSSDALVSAMAEGPSPSLIIVDIAAQPDWPLIERSASQTVPPTPVLAFGAHRDVDGFRAAKSGGATRVVSNGDFHRDMTGYVRRYARATPDPDGEPVAEAGRTVGQADVAENTVP